MVDNNAQKPEEEKVPRSNEVAARLALLRAILTKAIESANPDADIKAAQQAAQQAHEAGDGEGQAEAWLLLAVLHEMKNEPTAALELLDRCLHWWTARNDEPGIALTLTSISVNLTRLGREEETFPHLQQRLSLFRKMNDTKGEAQAKQALAVLYKKWGDIASSQEILHEVLACFDGLGEAFAAANTRLNIAINYIVLKDAERARVFAEKSLAYHEANGNHFPIAGAYSLLGEAAMLRADHTSAGCFFERALTAARASGAPVMVAVCLGHLGSLYIETGRFEKAAEALNEAVALHEKDIAEGRGHLPAYCEDLVKTAALYGNAAYAERDEARALHYLLQARDLGEKNNIAILLAPVYAALVDLYDQMDQPRDALTASRKLRDVEQKLFNEESDQRLRGLQVRFELEKTQKDAEIAHLRSVELAGALVEMERLRVLAEERARTDALTGVSNRRFLEERLCVEFERANRHERPLSVALIDIDFFKRVNDTFGHGAGDKVLVEVADVLRVLCRENSGDHAARYGGEEFALMMPETTLNEALLVCERLRHRVESMDLSHVARGLDRVTISIGLATTHEAAAVKNKSHNFLLAAADTNLYEAKRSGRNRIIAKSPA